MDSINTNSRRQPIGLRATRRRKQRTPQSFTVSEGNSPYRELETNPNIRIGDFIRYETNNQMGQKTYIVIPSPEDGSKTLKLHHDYDMEMENLYNDFEDEATEMEAEAEEDSGPSNKRQRTYGGKKAPKRRTKRQSRSQRRRRSSNRSKR